MAFYLVEVARIELTSFPLLFVNRFPFEEETFVFLPIDDEHLLLKMILQLILHAGLIVFDLDAAEVDGALSSYVSCILILCHIFCLF